MGRNAYGEYDTWEEARAAKREEEKKRELEYDLDRAREEADRSARQLRDKESTLRVEMAAKAETIDELANMLGEREEELAFHAEFLEEKGLVDEFDTWYALKTGA